MAGLVSAALGDSVARAPRPSSAPGVCSLALSVSSPAFGLFHFLGFIFLSLDISRLSLTLYLLPLPSVSIPPSRGLHLISSSVSVPVKVPPRTKLGHKGSLHRMKNNLMSVVMIVVTHGR